MSTTFQVGDRVKVPLGPRNVTGVIVEDRGAIGVRGRRLYQVRVFMDPFEPAVFEMPEDEIEHVPEAEWKSRKLDRQQVLDYLTNGGLITILRSNTSGGTHQPRVWLCFDSLGGITHTFLEENGIVGGQIVPSSAIHGDRIFAPKRDGVLAFLQSFGLSRKEAEDVLSTVGTAAR